MTDQSTYEALKERGSKLAEVLAHRLKLGKAGRRIWILRSSRRSTSSTRESGGSCNSHSRVSWVAGVRRASLTRTDDCPHSRQYMATRNQRFNFTMPDVLPSA